MDDIAALSDGQLVAETARKVARPRRDPADSFVLHSPLELTARALLLRLVAPSGRDAARRRIVQLGETFEAWGPAAVLPAVEERAFSDVPTAVAALAGAIGRGDVDAVDAPAAWIGDRADPHDLASLLGAEVLPRLGAAAHAPIFFFHLPRVAENGEVTGRLLRPLMRELARMPDARLEWLDDRGSAREPSGAALTRALGSARHRGRPEVDFIAPIMARVDDAETATLLGPVVGARRIHDRGREVLRSAARSMLLESTEFTPYIWTHCLTLPQAALGCAPSLSDPSLALAVAATHVVGFRSAFAVVPLDDRLPESMGGSLYEAIEAGPDEAAAVALGLRQADHSSATVALATRAAAHPDAHYVKYTLACLDAAAVDPDATGLYLAAAAKLAGYWSRLDRVDS